MTTDEATVALLHPEYEGQNVNLVHCYIRHKKEMPLRSLALLPDSFILTKLASYVINVISAFRKKEVVGLLLSRT